MHSVRRSTRWIGMAAIAFAAVACKEKDEAPEAPLPEFAQVTASAPPAATPVQSPDSFKVVFETSKGPFTVSVTRSLAPLGADRFYELVQSGYFHNVVFFRVVPGFVAQFGMHGDAKTNKSWMYSNLQDEPTKTSNVRGTVVFAHAGPNTRSNQFFINFGDNTMLDSQGFPPFGRVTEGLDVVDKLNGEYGEAPDQAQIEDKGNEYLAKTFPRLDFIRSAKIIAN